MNTRSIPARLLPVMILALGLALTGCSDDDDPTAPGGGGNNNNNGDPAMEFAATKDAYVSAGSAGANFGSSAKLETGDTRSTFLTFDLTGLPAHAVVTGMTLNLMQTAETGAGEAGSVTMTWAMDDDWDESAITWDTAPDVYEFLGNMSVEALGSGTRTMAFGNDIAHITAKREVLYENAVLTVRLQSDTDLTFLSNNTADPAMRPQLVLEYVVGTEVVLTPIADTHTNDQRPDENYNDEDYLTVDRQYSNVFMKFDLSDLPMGAVVQRAELRALATNGFAYGGDGNVYTTYVAEDSWTETGLTHNNQPGASTQAYGHWWLWYDNVDTTDKAGVNDDFALLPVVAREVEGDGLLSLRLNSPGYRTHYYPREHADTSMRPRLTVLYTQ